MTDISNNSLRIVSLIDGRTMIGYVDETPMGIDLHHPLIIKFINSPAGEGVVAMFSDALPYSSQTRISIPFSSMVFEPVVPKVGLVEVFNKIEHTVYDEVQPPNTVEQQNYDEETIEDIITAMAEMKNLKRIN